jgi:small subunit ribosomal protein S15e
MVGSVVDCYGGKYWNSVEVKADMIGHYLGEFSLTYKPIKHGKVGVGATRSSKFTSLKWRVLVRALTRFLALSEEINFNKN